MCIFSLLFYAFACYVLWLALTIIGPAWQRRDYGSVLVWLYVGLVMSFNLISALSG